MLLLIGSTLCGLVLIRLSYTLMRSSYRFYPMEPTVGIAYGVYGAASCFMGGGWLYIAYITYSLGAY